MAKLPEAIIQQRPQLLVTKAWICFYQFALGSIPPLLEALELVLDDDASSLALQGEVDFFWGHHLYWLGESVRSLDLLNHALERIPEDHHAARAEAEIFWGLASQMAGHEMEAVQSLNRIASDESSLPPRRRTRVLGSLIFIHVLSGELTKAAQATAQLRALGMRDKDA